MVDCVRHAVVFDDSDAVTLTASENLKSEGISGFLKFWCGFASNGGGVLNNSPDL